MAEPAADFELPRTHLKRQRRICFSGLAAGKTRYSTVENVVKPR